MTLSEFISGFLGTNAIEVTAAVCGFICVFLLIKGNIWNFAFGFVQVTLYVWVFYQAKLYSDVGLHVVYMVLQVYGWWNWSRNLSGNTTVNVLQMNYRKLGMYVLIVLLSATLLGTFMQQNTDASFAYADAFTTCASLVAFVLMTRRYIVNWLFWIAVDLVAIVVYFQKELYPTVILYLCFLVMAIVGYYSWKKEFK
ncbi:nicotinamide riboside transporter PnuC [Glaciecola sp.]|jgi:nicotinamide mononucleotide transporter|uniref:nicotinamide riboside transporter PnuC n=1 Tax=Glaciecola sp. MF2-115 TaxID=3384827 RepID=UPI0039898BC4